MFTEYALNALLKQTYARAPFLPLSGRPTPTPVGGRERRVYITGKAWRKLRDLARNLSAPMEKVGGESARSPSSSHRGELQRASLRPVSLPTPD